MSTKINVDPTTYLVPSNQALIFSTTDGNVKTYSYKLTSGSTGVIPGNTVVSLGLNDENLPSLVYQHDLLKCLNGTFEGYSDPRSSLAHKSTKIYEKLLDLQKLNKAEFLNELTSLATKGELFTKVEMIEILQAYLGATVVENIVGRDQLTLTDGQYVWVLDTTNDNAVAGSGPALYKYSANGGFIYIAPAVDGFNPGAIGGTYHRQLISEDSTLEYKDWVMVDTNCNVHLPKLKVDAYVCISTIGDANGVSIIPQVGDTIYINKNTQTSDGLVLYQSHACVELFGTAKGWCISRKDGNFAVIEEDTPEAE